MLRNERRRQVRYSIVETAYAAIGSSYDRVGKVKDCSKEGLSFEYMESGGRNHHGSTVDIFIMDDAFHIHNLPCSVVYDVPLYGSYDGPFRSRRCGIHFGDPTSAQRQQITSFLEQFAIP